MIDLIIDTNWASNDDFRNFVVNQSENGTIFHLPEFLNYHEDAFFEGIEKYHIKFIKEKRIIAGICGVVKNENGKKSFVSPYGASYGGLVAGKDLAYHDYEAIYNLLFEFLKSIVQSVRITPSSEIHSLLNRSFYNDYILLANGAGILKSDMLLVHAVDENEKLIKRLDKKTATELNQPLKKNNLELDIINGVDEESYLLLFASQQRMNSRPTHSLAELIRIEKILPETIHTFKIRHDGLLVAGIITFSVNKNVLNTFYIFDGATARDVKANHFSYYNVLKWAREKNFKYLDFGPSSFGYTPNYPLIKFKEKFDSKPYLRPVYSIEFK